MIHRLANPGRIRRLSPIEERELNLLIFDEALELDLLVMTIPVRVANDVGQGLVDCEGDLKALIIRQTIDLT
jgi:hypothetical protein